MDPAVDALATLITEELMAVLPRIITRIRNSEEFVRNFSQISTEKKEPEKGETSKKPKRRSAKRRKRTVNYTDAIPISQILPGSTTRASVQCEGKTPHCPFLRLKTWLHELAWVDYVDLHVCAWKA
ncbi:hypothetical protein E3N88_03914 [Mikania micrantha]|uniref:Uncharacterized protein n=1 Tax=Mikania micrantha TaxID=192012 RepID=A0A5N6PUU1_9ASTR|nr:hypothetical protein E3N88_03914 [Mikania micrantha]